MLHKLALDQYSKNLSEEEARKVVEAMSLLTNVWASTDYRTKENIDKIMFLKEVYPWLDYKGVLYRGIGVEDENLENLFFNREFTTWDRRKQTAKESWSTDINIAKGYMTEAESILKGGKSIVSVVLKSDSSKLDVIINLYKETRDRLNKELGELASKFNIKKVTRVHKHKGEDLKEVMVRSTPSTTYTLCEDVILVHVPKEYFKSSYGEFIMSTMTEETVSKVVEFMKSGWKTYPIFKCDSEGKLTLLSDKFSRLN